MFVREIVSKPAYVEGRKFVDRTIESKFKRADVSICTTYMNDKPILKKYIFDSGNVIKDVLKVLKNGNTREILLDKNLNVIG